MIKYLEKNRSYTAPVWMTPRGIMIHSTGCNQKNPLIYWKNWNTPAASASVHGVIGEINGKIDYVQMIPYRVKSWHCGKGSKGSYNNGYIGIEIAEDNLKNREYFERTRDYSISLLADLCKQFSIDPTRITTHCEAHADGYASNHADVLHWWRLYGYNMDQFRKDVRTKMNDQKNTPTPYATEAWEKAAAKGFTDGSRPQDPLTREQLFVILSRMNLLT